MVRLADRCFKQMACLAMVGAAAVMITLLLAQLLETRFSPSLMTSTNRLTWLFGGELRQIVQTR
jgi:hypothetical protein